MKDGSNYIVDDYYKGYKWLEPLGACPDCSDSLDLHSDSAKTGKIPLKMPGSWPGGTMAAKLHDSLL